jgi:hypothetical protein
MRYIDVVMRNLFLLSIILLCSYCSSNEKNESAQVILNSEEVNKSKSAPEDIKHAVVELEGVYSGTDNVGMESSLILKSGGNLITQSSIGDGGPAYGHWEGDAEDVTLYLNSEYGPDQMLGHAKITESGLKIIGGNFYTRK